MGRWKSFSRKREIQRNTRKLVREYKPGATLTEQRRFERKIDRLAKMFYKKK